MEPQADETSGQRANRLARDDDRPGRRAAERLLRDVRPEHEERGVRDQEVEGDPEGQEPHPGVFREGLPALAQLADEVRRGRGSSLAGQSHHPQQQRARPVRRPVEEEGIPRADRRHERAADRGSDGKCRIPGDAHEAVRLLEQPARHGLRDEPGGGLEGDHLPDSCVTADEQRAHHAADDEVRGVRADHHESTGHAVGDDSADQERRDLRQRPGCKGKSNVRRRAAQAENRERDRDRRQVRPEERDRPRREEVAEVSLAQN